MGIPHTHRPAVIREVKEWKRALWREVKSGDRLEDKFQALKILIEKISDHYEKGRPLVSFKPTLQGGTHNPATHEIIIGKELSIITALHELAHFLFGADEEKACRWSVWLFKKTFPKAFSQLEWEGHLLRRRKI